MRKPQILRLIAGVCVSTALYALEYNFKTVHMAKVTHHQLAREEKLTEQAGVPLSRASLIDVKPPATRDAGPIYEQLRALWKGRESDEDTTAVTYLCQNHSPTPVEMANARQALKRQARTLSLIHLAASKPYCVLQIDWAKPNPSEIPYPQLATVRNSARFLAAESILLAADGRSMDAVRNAALGFKIAKQGAAGKSSIAYLVSLACDAITLGAMRKILYLYGDKPGVAALVHDEIAQNFHTASAAAGLRTEAVLNVGLLEYLRTTGWRGVYELSGEEPSRFERLYIPLIGSSAYEYQLNSSGIVVLQQTRQAISVADRPFYQFRPTLTALSNDLSKKPEIYGIAKVILPQFEKLIGKRALVQDDAQMVMLAAQLIERHNRLSVFSSSVPTPIDMYTGKPLRYRREGAGFIIYTPGLEGTFDGGAPTAMPKTAEYVFHYPMPAYYLTPEPKSP